MLPKAMDKSKRATRPKPIYGYPQGIASFLLFRRFVALRLSVYN
jgi:hypothetical protein